VTAVRIFVLGGLFAYRALFTWARPSVYVPTLLGSPLFQILFFAYLGRFAGVQDDAFFVVGNGIQVAAMSGVYGMSMVIAGERWTGTLSAVLASPANRVALFVGRMVPLLLNGFVVSAFGFTAGWLLLDFQPPASSLPALGLAMVVSAASCTCLGALIGGLALRSRDVVVLANLVYFLMLLFCGVNVPVDALPGWMEIVGRGLPLTHGIEAARELAAGAPLGTVSGLLGVEALVGACYALLGYVTFRVLEVESRRRASLELI
jgi:ABC-2 type transport system permease protein